MNESVPRLLDECHRWFQSGRNAIGFKLWSDDSGSSILVVAQESDYSTVQFYLTWLPVQCMLHHCFPTIRRHCHSY
jgi:hypothetical protein